MKVFKNLLAVSSIAILVFLSCDHKSPEEKWEAEIRYFFMQHQEDYNSYEPLSFKKIDLAFFESQEVVNDSLLVLQDTTRLRVRQLYLANLSDQAQDLSAFGKEFRIDQVDDYLKLRASAERLLSKKKGLAPLDYQKALEQEDNAIEMLSQVLSYFNLSIYSIDFENDPIIYLHQYKLDEQEMSAVFELDKEKGNVISFREIS